MSAPLVIGVDAGTTATKAAVFGTQGAVLSTALREYPLAQPHPGWQVQDADVVTAALLDAVADVVAGTDRPIAALSLSSAMHGLIGLDAAGRPLTPLITWADARSADEARTLRASPLATRLHALTGTPVHPMTPLTKLMWFARHEPELCGRVAHWVDLKAYLLQALTGELVTELSSASATGLLDVHARRWSSTALEVAGVPASKLPRVVSPLAVLPLHAVAARRLGLPSGLPVVAGGADGPLGNLGTGAIDPGIAALSLGTSGAVRTTVHRPTTDPSGGLFCYALTEDLWVLGGAVSNGGSVVRWAGRMLNGYGAAANALTDAELLDGAATVPPGSDGLFMLPYLLTERSPHWDPELPGAYLGLRAGHDARHLVRAAVEGVCRQLAVVTDQLDAVAPIASVRATGGALRSPLWASVLASALRPELRVLSAVGGSALGAAALGLCAIGGASSVRDAAATLLGPDPGRRIAPDPAQRAAFAASAAGAGDLAQLTTAGVAG